MSRILRQRIRKEVIVTLKAGSSFQGVLYDQDRQSMVLRKAVALGMAERGEHVAVDGEVLILLADVDFMQLP